MRSTSIRLTDSNVKVVSDLDYHNQDSRYKSRKIYIDEDSNYFHELPIPPHDIEVSEEDDYYKVDASTANRLDYVAHLMYRNSKLWWVIALANSIEDPNNLPMGTVLSIPSLSSLYGHGGVLA